MRTVAAFVVASIVWSSSASAQPELPPEPLPPLPAAEPAPARATTAPPEPGPSGPPGAPPPPPAHAPPPPDAAHASRQDTPTPGPASEQTAPTHHGFYLRASTGFADVSVTGTAPGGGPASVAGFGSRVGVAIGGSPTPGLAIAFDLEVGTVSGTFNGGPQIVATTTYPQGSSTTETLSGHAQAGSFLFGGLVDWFPDPHGGWHIGASVGLGGSSITDDAYHAMTSTALGLGASGGYNWWLGRAFSAGIDAFVLGTLSASATDASSSDTGYVLGSVAFGVGGQVLYY